MRCLNLQCRRKTERFDWMNAEEFFKKKKKESHCQLESLEDSQHLQSEIIRFTDINVRPKLSEGFTVLPG